MAEPDRTPEGWRLPVRRIAWPAVLTPVVLLVCVALAGWAYKRTLAPGTYVPPTAFPTPGIEDDLQIPAQSRPMPTPTPSPDRAIARAKAAVVHDGIAGWSAQR